MWGKRASVAPAPKDPVINEPRSNIQKAVQKAFETGRVPNNLKLEPYNNNNVNGNNLRRLFADNKITDINQLVPTYIYTINDRLYEFYKNTYPKLYFKDIYTKKVLYIDSDDFDDYDIYFIHIGILDTGSIFAEYDKYHNSSMRKSRKKRKSRRRTRR